MRISIKEHKDIEININVHKGFKMVWSIMPTSTDERKYFTIIKTVYKIGVLKYCKD